MVRIEGESKKEIAYLPPPNEMRICMPYDNSFVEERFELLSLKKINESLSSDERKIKSFTKNEENFYIRLKAFDKMLIHSYEMAKKGKEAMGFMIGDVRRWEKEYTVVYDVITASLETTSFSVRFTREAFEELSDKLDDIEYEYIIAGWYHSHVGYSSFMSDVDISTQKLYFNKPFHAAMVIDPINMEAKLFRLYNETCFEIPYIIFE
ncbi:MAG: hypothetical protein J7K61_01620 [Thermoplasmata archaeon]|nr:hypothetical protein [Thermoplasmata archaeon]